MKSEDNQEEPYKNPLLEKLKKIPLTPHHKKTVGVNREKAEKIPIPQYIIDMAIEDDLEGTKTKFQFYPTKKDPNDKQWTYWAHAEKLRSEKETKLHRRQSSKDSYTSSKLNKLGPKTGNTVIKDRGFSNVNGNERHGLTSKISANSFHFNSPSSRSEGCIGNNIHNANKISTLTGKELNSNSSKMSKESTLSSKQDVNISKSKINDNRKNKPTVSRYMNKIDSKESAIQQINNEYNARVNSQYTYKSNGNSSTQNSPAIKRRKDSIIPYRPLERSTKSTIGARSNNISRNITISKDNNIEKMPAFIKVNGIGFKIKSILGSGGSSKVYKVEQKDGKLYALKVAKIKEAEKVGIFCKNEIKILKLLQNNQDIIKLIDYEEKCGPGELHLVFEMAETDLFKIRDVNDRSCVWNWNFIKDTWKSILLALNSIHELNIIHADIKLENIVIIGGKIKLIDFGSSVQVNSNTESIKSYNTACTVNFASPEFINVKLDEYNKKYVLISKASDIWSLGCLLYTLIYGFFIFYKNYSKEEKERIIYYDELWNHVELFNYFNYKDANGKWVEEPVPNSAKNLIKECLRYFPAGRPTIKKLLEMEL